jgi:microcystin-dependent protein
MSYPFMNEIRIFSFNFAPKNWAQCNGQLLPINQNQALFSLLGTTYGGDGRQNFALPNLRGRVPIHVGPQFSLGQYGGEESHPLNISEMPTHTHTLYASTSQANVADPTNAVLARSRTNQYRPATNLTTLHPASVSNIGGSQMHENRQPFLVLNFCICMAGIFPSQT